MRSLRSATLTLLFAAVTGAALPNLASPAWIPNGNPICTAGGDQLDVTAISDGGGGMLVVWRDQRRGPTLFDLFATRVSVDGSIAPGWPTDGLLLCQTGTAGAISPVADGAGGLLLFWFDTSTYQPRMQSVNGNGVLAAGFPANGKILPITVGGPPGYNFRAVADDAGGAYVLWNSYNGTIDALSVTRLIASGGFAAGWTANGVRVGGGAFRTGPWVALTLATDPAGGVLSGEIYSVEDEPSGSSKYGSLRRALSNGTLGLSASLSPTGYNGSPGGHATVSRMSNTPDGLGGAFAAWRVNGSLGPDYMQHYLANGTASWPTPTSAPVTDAMFRDDDDGIYLLGRPVGPDHLQIHRRSGDGSTPTGWNTGLLLSTVGSYSAFAGTLSGTKVYTSWSNAAISGDDILATALLSDGSLSPNWTAGGNVVCDATGQQVLGAIVSGLANDALLAWSDSRAGAADVYASRLIPAGPAATAGVPGGGRPSHAVLVAERVAPNPAREHAEFAFTLPDEAQASIEIVDLAGRVVSRIVPAVRAGRQSVGFVTSRMANGLYFVRLRHGSRTVCQRFSIMR